MCFERGDKVRLSFLRSGHFFSSGRSSINSLSFSRSSALNSVRKAWLIAPFSACSQQERILCTYAPLPLAFPVRSMATPSELRTNRVRSRFCNTDLQPMQVRCGTCFTFFCGFLATCPSHFYSSQPQSFAPRLCFFFTTVMSRSGS